MTGSFARRSLAESLPLGEWLTARRFAVLLALLIILMFWDVIFGATTFFYRDFGFFSYPLAYYNRASFAHGEIPFWNPLSNCGLPYVAQWNTMVFYPLSLFHVLLPLPWSLAVFNLGHLFLAGLGMYFLAHRWSGSRLAGAMGGLTFAFSGLMLNCLMWPNNIAAFAWLPWLLWRVEKAWRSGGREVWIGSAVTGLQLLSGGAEIIVFTWLMAGALALTDFVRPVALSRSALMRRFLMVLLVGTALAAVQLFPFLDLLLHSQRDSGFGDSRWSMPRWGWANLILPLFGTRPSHGGVYLQPNQYWTSSYYLGIGVVLLIIGAWPGRRSKWVWWSLGLGGLILALGDGGFLYSPLKSLFPALGMMRFPIKFVVLPTVAFPILAAQALAGYLKVPATDWLNAFGRLVAGAIIVALALAALLWHVHTQGGANGIWLATLHNGLIRAILMILMVGALYLLRHVRGWGGQIGCTLGLLALFWIDLSSHMPNQNPTAARTIYARDLVAPYLPNEPRPVVGGSRAMLTPLAQLTLRLTSLPDPSQQYPSRRAALLNNCNLLEGVPKVNGFYSLYTPEQAGLSAALYMPTNLNSPGLLDFMGVSHLTSGQSVFEWEKRSSFLPLLMVGQQPVYVPDTAALSAVTAADFDPTLEVYLPESARAAMGVTNRTAGRIVKSHFGTHELTATVWSEGSSILTIAQTYYHCWTASVNGRSTPIWKANYGFQAVRLPPGLNEVRLVYRERSFRWGATITCLAILVCAVGWRVSAPGAVAGAEELL